MTRLREALTAWADMLGPDNVHTDPASLAAAATTTYATTQQVPAILRPGSRAEVQECLRIANRFGAPLYPVSKGKNWGYGSRVPVADGCVILDLGRLNRILDVDEKLGTVTVEPGVTFRQLYEHLRAGESNLMMSVIGSTPEGSLIGNLLERGIGNGQQGDRCAHVCGLEVVLPTGDCVHTGFARFPNAQAATVHRSGLGPSLDGLFIQSNLGVVTRMTMWLWPFPDSMQLIGFTVQGDKRLESLLDTLRHLLMIGLLQPILAIRNDCRTMTLSQRYPWAEALGRTPLPPHLRAALGGKWSARGVLLASPTHALGAAVRTALEQALTGHVEDLSFQELTPERLPPWDWLGWGALLDTPAPAADKDEARKHFVHQPTEADIASAYWRKKGPLPATLDLDRDQCGVLFFAPVVPLDGARILQVARLLEEIFAAHQFEPQLTIRCMTVRCAYVVAVIMYDREVDGEDERALACYEQMSRRCAELGCFSYRLGTHAMQALPPPHDDHGALMRKLKRALDPNDILAPGRYDFRSTWPRDGEPQA